MFTLIITFYISPGVYSVPSIGLYFQLGNQIYLPGQTINRSDIGEQPSNRSDPGFTLVCVTTNVNTACCRRSDGGNVGEWYYPNGMIVNRHINSPTGAFHRTGYQQQVRLAWIYGATVLLGVYRCEVPDEQGNIVSASIILSSKIFLKSSELYLICGLWECSRG